jgi:hypothetical protein
MGAHLETESLWKGSGKHGKPYGEARSSTGYWSKPHESGDMELLGHLHRHLSTKRVTEENDVASMDATSV